MDKCKNCAYNKPCTYNMKNWCMLNNYELYTTQEDIDYCNMLCGNIEYDQESNEIDE